MHGFFKSVNESSMTEISIIGTKLDLGTKITHLNIIKVNLEELEKFVVANEEDNKFLLKIEQAELIEMYPQWCFPENQQ